MPCFFLSMLMTCMLQSHLFADDAKHCKEVQFSSDILKLQCDLNILANWSDQWNLGLNMSKFHLIFSKEQNTSQYWLIGSLINRTVQTKDLGVMLTIDLSWSDH